MLTFRLPFPPLAGFFLIFLGFVPSIPSICLAETSEQPNVIVIMSDDQGYGELSCHGNPILKTPALDTLQKESISLTDFHVAPMCTPTRGQLLTGLDAFRNKAMNVSSGRTLLKAGLPTMADVFTANGYQTGIFGKWHLGDNYPFRPQDRGFQETLWFPSSHIHSVPDSWNNDYFDDVYFHNGERKNYQGYCTDVFFSEAMKWIKTQKKNQKPFFAYLPTNAPHWPHFVPDHYRKSIASALKRELPNLLTSLNQEQQTSLTSFLAMIANIDENIGRLDQMLEIEGLKENTVVIFLTDNGSTFGHLYYNAGMKGKKTMLWEGGHRVPCFIRWPGGNLRKPGEVNELTQVQDLLPTLVDLCNLKTTFDNSLDGTSLTSLLRGETEQLDDRMVVVNFSRMPRGKFARPNSNSIPTKDGAGVLWQKWRFLNNKELYNVEQDPLQETDLASQHPEIVSKMRSHLNQWWDSLKAEVNEPECVVIGHEAENPMMITACEWLDVFVDQQIQIRRGERKNGVWHIEVASSGDYLLELRRWPKESGLPLNANVPEEQMTDGVYKQGTVLPIRSARIQIGDQSFAKAKSSPKATSIRFEVPLEAGKTTLQTWWRDNRSKPICGAYYVYITKK
ncbi:N-acetylgalactosamine 6-sulfate sulfatase [Planctomycetales bacterium 10988]|nr:N-acetylgalactosamine 6-sulfate sulfatase [Planctomycetales bacterium 10988]